MTILIDMDDVIEQLLKTWLEKANEKYGCNVQREDVREWTMHKAFPMLTNEQVWSVTYEPGFWGCIEPMPGAAEAIRRLMDAGHEVFIVTATEYGHLYEKMHDLLFKYFPFLSWEQVIVTSRKQLIRGDVLVDDGVHNLIGGEYRKILFDAPYNRSFDTEANGMVRVHNWEEAEREILKIAEEMKHE